MKTFKQFLLEFDPNRGAPGRATPIIPHYPTADELAAGHKQNPNLPGQISNIGKKIKQLTLQPRSRFDPIPVGPADRLRAYSAGKRGIRWQPTGAETQDQFASQMVAHAAGAQMETDSQAFPKLTSQTPAGQLQTKINNQETKFRSLRPKARFDIRGVGKVM